MNLLSLFKKQAQEDLEDYMPTLEQLHNRRDQLINNFLNGTVVETEQSEENACPDVILYKIYLPIFLEGSSPLYLQFRIYYYNEDVCDWEDWNLTKMYWYEYWQEENRAPDDQRNYILHFLLEHSPLLMDIINKARSFVDIARQIARHMDEGGAMEIKRKPPKVPQDLKKIYRYLGWDVDTKSYREFLEWKDSQGTLTEKEKSQLERLRRLME